MIDTGEKNRRRDVLIDRACRVLMRDRRYTKQRARALIRWLGSDFQPTSDFAGRTIAKLGPEAFEDLLSSVLSENQPTCPNAVWALELFEQQHDRLLPFLRQWIARSDGRVRLQCAVSLMHILTGRLRAGGAIDTSDVHLFRTVLLPIVDTEPWVRIHLRGFEQAAAE